MDGGDINPVRFTSNEVGGGIFSTLGVVIGIAGHLARLSFVLAGAVALLAGHAYSQLAIT